MIRIQRHHKAMIPFSLLLSLLPFLSTSAAHPGKEYLTAKEIERIQDAQEIDKRAKIYVDAAALRLKVAEERLNGKESEPGDPMEFYSVEDMLEAYFQIVRSVMMNLDGAAQAPRTDPAKIAKALRALKESSEKAEKSLEILKRAAEESKREELWNAVNRAIEVTAGARDGAESGLQQYKEKDEPPRKKKKG